MSEIDINDIKRKMLIEANDTDAWYKLISKIAGLVKCLPSSLPEDNEHIIRKIAELWDELATAHQRTKELEGMVEGMKSERYSSCSIACNIKDIIDAKCYMCKDWNQKGVQ